MTLPKTMREPRKARRHGMTASAWYYVNPNTIDVFCQSNSGATPSCRITRRQLEQALKIMRDAQ